MKKIIAIISLLILMFSGAINYNGSIVEAANTDQNSISGDLDGDGLVNTSDVIYLLMHTYFTQTYPVNQNCDYTQDGNVNTNDVIYLLMHTYFPDTYPLVDKNRITYDLGYEQFDTKNDLYVAFFTEFYNFLLNQTDCDLESFNIQNVDDFLKACSNWNFNNANSFYGVGNAFSKYFLTIEVGGLLENQPTDTFIGYCYQNNKFKDVIEHLEIFFAYWRTDEGYTKPGNNGNDFFASAWASLVDTCKFFYFTSSNLTDTYVWFTKERSPRVHYMLENIPGVGKVELVTDNTKEEVLPTLSRMHYNFLGWYDEAGNKATSTYQKIKLTAKWERIEYLVEYYNENEVIEYHVPSGRRVENLTFEKDGYQLIDIVTEDGTSFDHWNAITKDTRIFVLWEQNVATKGNITVVGVNSQAATSTVGQYYGIRLYKSGVGIGTSLYWYKVGINYQNNEYVITNIWESGQTLQNNYDYLLLVWNSGDDNNADYQAMLDINLQVGDIVKFPKNPDSYSDGENNIQVSFKENAGFYNLYLVSDGAEAFDYDNFIKAGDEYKLPTPTKPGYAFLGWYDNSDFVGDDYVTLVPTKNTVLYAKWQQIVMDEALDYVSDVVTSYTIDNLPEMFEGQTVIYTSSDPKLYTIENNQGHTNRRYQTHQKQTVTIYATLADGTKTSKQITINPVTYDVMAHPKAVYFSVGSAGSYKKYSERYLSEQTLFSDKFKNNMDMVYYAFAIPQENGTLTLNTTYLEEVMELKNYGIRVLMVIDGANAAPLKAMVKICNDASKRAQFVNNILNLVKTYNFDGVDVDWEFPGVLSDQAGYEQYTTAVDIANLNSLLKELREGMNSLQDDNGSNYILSVATPPTYWGTNRFDYATINKYCDYVNMMSYDLNKTSNASHLTHVYQPSNSYSYKFCCDYGVSYYTSLGLDKNKIILGSAAYGKAYKVTGTSPNSNLPGLGASATLGQVTGYGLAGQSITWNSGTIYYTGIQTLINTGKFTQYNEYNNSGQLVGSYLYNATDNYFITYDSVLSVTEKCKYAAANEGMGIMVWAYGEDATDTIVNTICDNLK